MKQIKIVDTTLSAENGAFGFKEKLEIARQLEKLGVDVIELSEIKNETADSLLVRTASSFVKNSVLSVAAGSSEESVRFAIKALSGVKNARIRIELPMSPVGMEYIAKKKPDPMLAWIEKAISMAKEAVSEVEFCAVDATRAEKEFLLKAISKAVSAGATHLCICDSAAEALPDDFAAFAAEIAQEVSIPVFVKCSNQNGLAAAASILAVKAGVDGMKVNVAGEYAPISDVASVLKNLGNHYSIESGIRQTELIRIVKQISWIISNVKEEKSVMTVSVSDETGIHLDSDDDLAAVSVAVAKLGYDLSEEDLKNVYDEFLRVAEKKNVGAKELDAIVASVALQVPTTFKLINYVVNSGNVITTSAQITLEKNKEMMQGICMGDGPVDAAFRAIDQIIGHHYELDDFQIQSVTEGKEAMGSALVKLRAGGKLYSGNGISTDIIGACIRAYMNALNKIIYEET